MEQLLNELKTQLAIMNAGQKQGSVLDDRTLEKLYSVYPFNKFEYAISHLIATNTISLQQYLDMRSAYLDRNKFLYLFEITAPRSFGETWAQRHLQEVVPALSHPNKKLDANYSGQYDFWYDGIRIEVKASRAVDRNSNEPLVYKALSSDSILPFDMNFQQIKPDCFDVMVWIAAWRNVIRYWVLTSDEIASNKYYSQGQHRGNQGEGQLWLTNENISEFLPYEVNVQTIFSAIKEKGARK